MKRKKAQAEEIERVKFEVGQEMGIVNKSKNKKNEKKIKKS